MEWVVLKNGVTWSDRFDYEDYCTEHIEDCVKRGLGNVEEFEYREMTMEEMIEYD